MPNRMQNAIRHFMFTVQSKICWVIRKYCGKITKDCFLTSKNWIALLFMILMCYLSCLFNSRGRLRGGAAITFFGFSREVAPMDIISVLMLMVSFGMLIAFIMSDKNKK